MKNCLTCGKVILEPNVAYGYAGPICYCPENPNRYRQRADEPNRGAIANKNFVEQMKDIMDKSLMQAACDEAQNNGYSRGFQDALEAAIKIAKDMSNQASARLGQGKNVSANMIGIPLELAAAIRALAGKTSL